MSDVINIGLPVSKSEKFFSVFSNAIVMLRDEYQTTLSELHVSEKKLLEASNELKNSHETNQELTGKIQTLVKSHRNLKEKYDKAVTEVQLNQKKLALLKEDLEKVNASLDATRQLLVSEIDQKAALQSRYDLVCAAISPVRHESERYKKFRTLLNESLFPFINRVNVLPNEAEQVMKIRAVDDELRLTDSLAAFSERTIVAVAGGFSSGKSSLITSLFSDNSVSLPIGIEPVTAIPTYVFHSDTVSISGYPKEGGRFNVPESVYARLSHQFVEEFGFNLRDLLPFMSLEVPMASCHNLSFIDLPGYNPGDRGGDTGGDKSASDEFVTQGQALIWVIGLDANGTVPGDDLDHLWELSELDIPIYVVLNKADLRPVDTLNEVLDQVVDELEANGIAYEGICAYSSECGGEISFRVSSLWDVLAEWDQPRDALGSAGQKLFGVLDKYEEAIKKDIEQRTSKAALVKALELNLLEVGAFEQRAAASFNINEYMEDSKNENIGVPIKEHDLGELITGAAIQPLSSIFRRVFDTHSNKEEVSKEVKSEQSEAQDDNLVKAATQEDKVTSHNDQVNEIRDQIQNLREDYSVKKSEENLKELNSIRSDLENIFRI